MQRIAHLLALATLLITSAWGIRKEDFLAQLAKEIQPDAESIAKSCGLVPFKTVQISLNALSYNAAQALIAKYEQDTPALLEAARSAIKDMAAECKKTPSLGPRMKKSGQTELEISFRAPAEDPKLNIVMVNLNGSFITIKLPYGRPLGEVAPAGLAGTQLNNRVR